MLIAVGLSALIAAFLHLPIETIGTRSAAFLVGFPRLICRRSPGRLSYAVCRQRSRSRCSVRSRAFCRLKWLMA